MQPRARAALIDPGENDPRIARMVKDSGATLEAVWLTHAHLDHIGGIAAVLREWKVPVYLHPLDREIFDQGANMRTGIPSRVRAAAGAGP